MLRKLLWIVLALVLSGQAWAGPSPEALVRKTTDDVILIVKQDKELRSGNSRKLYDLVESKILPHFDFAQMTRLAMAKNWNKATPEEQKIIVTEFRTLLVKTYSAALQRVLDFKIEVKQLPSAPGSGDVTIRMEAIRSGDAPFTIDYDMERQGDDWKVYDVKIEGVSMLTAYLRSFASEIKRGGVPGLIKSLSSRNKSAAGGQGG